MTSQTHAKRLVVALAVAALSCGFGLDASAQSRSPQPTPPAAGTRRPAARPPAGLEIRAIGLLGAEWFTASQSFDAILGSARGTLFGGGVSVTEGGGYIDVTALRFSKDGSRAFVGANGEVFQLGIPTTITVVPLDVTIGWRFRNLFRTGVFRRVSPHIGAGYTRFRYEETSDFSADDENVKESFDGFHVVGGAEVRLHTWIGLAGELMWTSVPDAIGKAGVSADFAEKDLGGTSLRLKLVIGK